MKKVWAIIVLLSIYLPAWASFLYEEIDPVCSITGTTHTHSAQEVSDTSSWRIPIAYQWECETTPELSWKQERKIYTAITKFYEKKNFLDKEANNWYTLNSNGKKYTSQRFFPAIKNFIVREKNKQSQNLQSIAILNYAASLIGYDYFITRQNLVGEYIGLSEQVAMDKAKNNDVSFRVVERDGEKLIMTMDYRPGRINAVVENGKVVSYRVE